MKANQRFAVLSEDKRSVRRSPKTSIADRNNGVGSGVGLFERRTAYLLILYGNFDGDGGEGGIRTLETPQRA
jgi:hypothetical protein